MIVIPESIQYLLAQDSISKNFRVHFVNGEYRDLVNKDFVSESVTFTESSMSSQEFKLGLCESGSIEFRTYFEENIRDCVIFCSIEVDISSLDYSTIQTYGQTSEDVPYVFYSIPYGYFRVDSCSKTEKVGIRKVIGYNNKSNKSYTSNFLYTPETIKKLLMWGKTVSTPDDTLNINIDVNNLIDDIIPNGEIFSYNPKRVVREYTKNNSGLFDDSSYYETIKTFVCKDIHINGHTYNSPVYIYVKGNSIHTFPDYKSSRNSTRYIGEAWYTSMPPEFGSRRQTSSTYVLQPEPNMPVNYNLTWNNTYTSESIQEAFKSITNYVGENFKDVEMTYTPIRTDTITHYIQKNARLLDWLISPCIKFRDASILERQDSSGYFNNYLDYYPCATICAYSGTSDSNSRAASYDEEERLTIADSQNKMTYAKISANQRIVNIPMRAYDDGRQGITLYYDWYQCLDKGLNASFTHTEYLNTTQYTCDNLIDICIPKEIYICVLNKNYDYITPPYPCDSPSSYQVFSISVNNMLSPKLQQYVNFTEETAISKLKMTFNTKSYSYIEPFEDEGIKYFESTYLQGTLLSKKYVYRVPPEKLNEMFSSTNITNILSSWAELQGLFAVYSRTKVNSFELVRPVETFEILYPSNSLYPSDDLFPSESGYLFSRNDWYKLSYDDLRTTMFDAVVFQHKAYDPSTAKYEVSEIVYGLSNKFSNAQAQIQKRYDLKSNFVLNNRYVDPSLSSKEVFEEELEIMSGLIYVLTKVFYNRASLLVRAQPELCSGDCITAVSQDSAIIMYITSHKISGIQSLKDSIESR